jgi:tetratricopeptide (TPR) repeat protein
MCVLLRAQDLRQARDAFQAGDPAKVIEIARHGLEHGESGELHNLLGKAYAMSGQPDKVVPELSSAIRLQPDNEAFRFDLAQFLLNRQDFKAAATALEDAQKRLPRSAQIELALGVAYYGQVRYNDAVRAFLKTIDLAPDVPQPYLFLGRMLEHARSHLREIITKCAVSERSDPLNPYAPLLRAKALMAQLGMADWDDKAQEAAGLLEKAIALKGDSADAYFELGCLMDRKKDYSRAAELLEKSIQLKADDPVAHYRLARVYLQLGKKEKAAAEFALNARLARRTGLLP